MPSKFSEVDELNVPAEIHLYNGSSSTTLDTGEIAAYIKEKFGDVTVDVREGIFQHHIESSDLAELSNQLAKARVKNTTSQRQDYEPLYGEVRVERRFLEDAKEMPGILYDGLKLYVIANSIILADESYMSHAHIILTDRLFGTFDRNDLRYHARVIICGYPSIISTSGVVEAPAKPKEFYMLRRKYAATGLGHLPVEAVKKEFKDLFIDYNDPRLTEVMKGYVLQALFYHMTFSPFCDDVNCRLYNAHWQSELLKAQLASSYEFCERHTEVLRKVFAHTKQRRI